jgi:hypothetical protein
MTNNLLMKNQGIYLKRNYKAKGVTNMLVDYAVFEVNVSKAPPDRLVYVIETKEKTSRLMEKNDISPHAYGLDRNVSHFANYYVVPMNELNEIEKELY